MGNSQDSSKTTLNCPVAMSTLACHVSTKARFAALLIALSGSLFWTYGQEQKEVSKPDQKQVVKAELPKVIAVEFYADWCASCKVLMPKVAEVKSELQGKPILFTRFDMTNEFTKEQASYMAGFTGLEEVHRKGGGRTGFLALVDAKTKAVLGVINKDKTVEDIKKMLNDAITKATAS